MLTREEILNKLDEAKTAMEVLEAHDYLSVWAQTVHIESLKKYGIKFNVKDYVSLPEVNDIVSKWWNIKTRNWRNK